jgi:UDP-N-acetyl-D-mannosaminuronic acid dehydrogenase
MSLAGLQKRIETKSSKIGIVGLGYVGLAVACKFAEAGFTTVGLEYRSERVDLINAGILPIQGKEPGLAELLRQATTQGKLTASTNPHILKEADIILVAVETPVDLDTKAPNYGALKSALITLGQVIKPGILIIVESTIAPGTMDRIVRPLLEKTSGLKVNQDFYLGHCPERVMPGRLLQNLSSMSRVCGGYSPETSQVMTRLYQNIVEMDLDMTDCVTAEMVKTTENTYRDVQIAFANEIALICEAVGADVWRVRELVNKSPNRDIHLPGAGVGGHCIPKDPWLLVYSANGKGVGPSLIPRARQLNDSMPLHMAELLEAALTQARCSIQGAKIAVLGYAYLENSDDTRNSPSQTLVAYLRQMGAHVIIHDPYVPEYKAEITETVKGADGVVIMVGHDVYRDLNLVDLKPLLNHPVLIDGRRVFEPEAAHQAGFVFRGIGRGKYAR